MKQEEKLVKLLTEKGLKLSTAESCTGGLISQLITDVSGASCVFECGVCSYSNDIKIKVLGVSERTIDEFTEVSLQTAEEMAIGVKRLSSSDISVSTTGVAGPTGGTEENPVGTVCMGFVIGNEVISEKKNFNSDGLADRKEIRRRCAEYCLNKICLLVEKCEKI